MASTLLLFPALSADLAASSSPARFARRNGHNLIQFANAATEEAIFTGQLPEAYLGEGLTVVLPWVAQSAASGNVVWGVSFQRLNQAGVNLDDAATWSTEQTTTSGAAAVSGKITNATITFDDGAEIANLAASENFRMRVRRLGSDGSDTMANAAQLLTIRVSQSGAAGTLTVRESDDDPEVVGVTEVIVGDGKLTDNGGGSVTIDLSGSGGGGITVTEEDDSPDVTGVTEIRVTNGTLTNNGSGSVSLDLSGSGGGGFFSDGGGTNATVGKGAVAPTAGGVNSLAQGDDSNATGDNSFALGDTCEALGASSFAQGALCKINSNLSDAFTQGTNQYLNYGTAALGYGPWFAQGSQNSVDFESKYYYSSYGGGYYFYYSTGFVQGYDNYLGWRGNQQFRYHIGSAVIGQRNNVLGAVNLVVGADNRVGQNASGQNNNFNSVLGFQNYVYGQRVLAHGSYHYVDDGVDSGHVFGDSGKLRFDAQYVWTSDRNLNDRSSAGKSQVSQIVRHLNTSATGNTTILTIPVETNKTYMVKVEIVARGGSGGPTTCAGIMTLPSGTTDQDGRYAIIDRDGTTTVRLRNQTTTDSTITLATIVAYGSLASLTGQLTISSQDILIQVSPGTSSSINYTARVLLVEVGT
jgi:hypothetical protein